MTDARTWSDPEHGFAIDVPPVAPSGAPGAGYTTTTTVSGPDTVTWNPVPGSWQQLR